MRGCRSIYRYVAQLCMGLCYRVSGRYVCVHIGCYFKFIASISFDNDSRVILYLCCASLRGDSLYFDCYPLSVLAPYASVCHSRDYWSCPMFGRGVSPWGHVFTLMCYYYFIIINFSTVFSTRAPSLHRVPHPAATAASMVSW